MSSLQFRYSLSPLCPTPVPHPHGPAFAFPRIFPPRIRGRLRVFLPLRGRRVLSICCSSKTGSQLQRVSVPEDDDRPPFDINLAVILAGFAFEAYTTPPENMGRREVDAAGCKTVYLSEYVLVAFVTFMAALKDAVYLLTKEPTWNEEFTFNIKQPPSQSLQVNNHDPCMHYKSFFHILASFVDLDLLEPNTIDSSVLERMFIVDLNIGSVLDLLVMFFRLVTLYICVQKAIKVSSL
ncbi:unnamed protein product [Sphenostylis stenocarpa]|uniref:Uncharacterized protein n=1 Tax=Sphenostylis stenocarpa TaxID=92480 RepID=A0AA86SRS1_9FABA|nr:unnamed protein product [Sphenostylis stenocarpa]